MNQLVSPIAIVILATILPTALLAQNPLVGAWEYQSTVGKVPKDAAANRGNDVSDIPDGGIIETRTSASETRMRSYVFSERHYSYFGLNSSQPRPLRRDVDEGATGGPKVTAEQKLKEYNALDVEFGSYRIEGNQIHISPILDKIPDNMLRDGEHDRAMFFEIEGDTLSLIRYTGEPGVGVKLTDTYIRLD